MAQELIASSGLLCTAIDRYLSSCTNFRDSYIRGIAFKSVPPELLKVANNELLHLTSFRTKIKQAKAAISAARNSAPTIVPINALPSEILARVFQLVLNSSGYTLHTSRKLLPQDLLSHVCSRWRQIATDSHALWSQVYLPLYSADCDYLVARAETYVIRAGLVPLDFRVYVNDPVSQAKLSALANLVQLSSSVAPQIRSLQLYTHGMLTGLYRSLMQSFFAAGAPGIFDTLVVCADEKSYDGHYHHFIGSADSPNTTESLLLDIPQQVLEELWLPVRVMRLHGLYPYWTSKAYHCLVELRLVSNGSDLVSVAESQLVDILVASPGLQTLVFNFAISNSGPRYNSMVPVRLEELEFVSFYASWWEETDSAIEIFLRLLAPGPKPLSLSITGRCDLDRCMLNDDVKKFLLRANVTKLSLDGSGTYSLLSEVFQLSPHLRELSLDSFNPTANYNPPSESEADSNRPNCNLDNLTMVYCGVDLRILRRMMERDMKSRSLSVWECFPEGEEMDISEGTLTAELSDLCPLIRSTEPIVYRDLAREWEQLP